MDKLIQSGRVWGWSDFQEIELRIPGPDLGVLNSGEQVFIAPHPDDETKWVEVMWESELTDPQDDGAVEAEEGSSALSD